MVPGIALVVGKVDRPVDEDRQVGVHLDHAAVVAVPVVAAPRLAGHVLDREALRRGQLHVGHRPAPALGDRELEDLAETVARDDELFSEGFNTIDERTLPGSRRSRSSSVSRKCESGCVGATASYNACDSSSNDIFVPESIRTRARSASS